MEKYIKEFNLLYPNYQTKDFVGKCVIADPNCNPESDFLELTVTGCDGNLFPMNFASDSISFYTKASSREPMMQNCDGIFFTEYKDKKYLFVCELKSSFVPENIFKAKEQIVGTLMRLNSKCSILQTLPNWEVHGLIVSYAPSTERLVNISKEKSVQAQFSSYIYSQKHKVLLKNMCDRMYYPLDVPSFCIHYLGVPYMQQKYSIGIEDILKL